MLSLCDGLKQISGVDVGGEHSGAIPLNNGVPQGCWDSQALELILPPEKSGISSSVKHLGYRTKSNWNNFTYREMF